MCNDKPSYEELVEEKNGWRRLHDKYLKKCEELDLDNAKLREALEFYAKDDANAVECGILGSVDARPATKTLKEVG